MAAKKAAIRSVHVADARMEVRVYEKGPSTLSQYEEITCLPTPMGTTAPG